MTPPQYGRRLSDQKVNWTMLGVGITLLIQLCAIVWGAATLSNGLSDMRAVVGELKAVNQNLGQQMSNQAIQMAKLEATVQAMKEQGR